MGESSAHLSVHGSAPRVWLVGAGPGDPGLITVRARELLLRCDCVVHDQLVNPALVAQAPAEAPRHDVGKRGGATSRPQDEINALLVDLARRHRCVVRLKGGDPFVFGRGGEEALALARAGIAFGVVPGVTSGVAVPAYAGIPVTHRAASSAVVFVTGHQRRDDPEPPAMDWAAFAQVETVVLYMGMHKLAENCAALIEHGRAAETPAAIIQWGTYPRQRVVTGTLATIPKIAHDAGIGAPAVAKKTYEPSRYLRCPLHVGGRRPPLYDLPPRRSTVATGFDSGATALLAQDSAGEFAAWRRRSLRQIGRRRGSGPLGCPFASRKGDRLPHQPSPSPGLHGRTVRRGLGSDARRHREAGR